VAFLSINVSGVIWIVAPKNVVPIAKAVEEFLAMKKQDKAGALHRADLKARLERFVADNSLTLDKMTPERIDLWLRGLCKINQKGERTKEPVSLQTRNHYRAAITNLLHFASLPGRRWLSFSPVEFEQSYPPASVERGEVAIFTPADTQKLLHGAPEALLGPLVFGFFSGLRPSEVLRLHWEDVDLNAGHVFVRGKVRTARYRIAPLLPNAVAWLRGVDRRRKVCDYFHPGDAGSALAARLGVEWIHDGPRHSFVSYRLAIVGDLGKVSEETGTSAKTLRLHYRRPIPKSVAEEYFAYPSERRQSL
jgi:integrase